MIVGPVSPLANIRSANKRELFQEGAGDDVIGLKRSKSDQELIKKKPEAEWRQIIKQQPLMLLVMGQQIFLTSRHSNSRKKRRPHSQGGSHKGHRNTHEDLVFPREASSPTPPFSPYELVDIESKKTSSSLPPPPPRSLDKGIEFFIQKKVVSAVASIVLSDHSRDLYYESINKGLEEEVYKEESRQVRQHIPAGDPAPVSMEQQPQKTPKTSPATSITKTSHTGKYLSFYHDNPSLRRRYKGLYYCKWRPHDYYIE